VKQIHLPCSSWAKTKKFWDYHFARLWYCDRNWLSSLNYCLPGKRKSAIQFCSWKSFYLSSFSAFLSFFLSLHSRVAGRSHHYGLFVLLNSYCQYLRKNPLNKPNEVASEHENYSNVCHCFHYSSLHITNRKLFYFNVIQIKYVSSYSNVLELN